MDIFRILIHLICDEYLLPPYMPYLYWTHSLSLYTLSVMQIFFILKHLICNGHIPHPYTPYLWWTLCLILIWLSVDIFHIMYTLNEVYIFQIPYLWWVPQLSHHFNAFPNKLNLLSISIPYPYNPYPYIIMWVCWTRQRFPNTPIVKSQ